MKFDLIIIGAGPSGLSLACSLAKTKLKIAVIEKNSRSKFTKPKKDGRDIALTHRSKNILKKFGIWKFINSKTISPVKEARILDGNSPQYLHLDHTKINLHPTDVFTRATHGDRAAVATTGAAGRARTVGVARTRAFEVGEAGTEIKSTAGWNSHPIDSTFQHYIFDVRMLCKLTLNDASKFSATNFVTNGSRVKGSISGATGIVYIPPQDTTFATAASCAYNDTAAGSAITVDSTAGIEPGMGVVGDSNSGIPEADGDVSYVTEILTATTCKISAATTGGSITSEALIFGNATTAIDGSKYSGGTVFHVFQTTGTFQDADVLTSSNSADFATSGVLDIDPTYYNMADAHSVYGANSLSRPYYADITPLETKKLTGTASTVESAVLTVAGFPEILPV